MTLEQLEAVIRIKVNNQKENKREGGKNQRKKHNLLFCIIEATPDSHVAWLWYSKRCKGGEEEKILVSVKSKYDKV